MHTFFSLQLWGAWQSCALGQGVPSLCRHHKQLKCICPQLTGTHAHTVTHWLQLGCSHENVMPAGRSFAVAANRGRLRLAQFNSHHSTYHSIFKGVFSFGLAPPCLMMPDSAFGMQTTTHCTYLITCYEDMAGRTMLQHPSVTLGQTILARL